MLKLGIPQLSTDEDTPEYRDRAKERRAAFGAGKKVSLPMKKSASTAQSSDANNPNDDDEPVAPSKGASLLGKMGWAAGEGLGAQGTGMKTAIATEMYVQGVGLGAEGGKVGDAMVEAERNTRSDYSDFLRQTKDKAKERFDRLG
jgi:RNA-binding protein 5/10